MFAAYASAVHPLGPTPQATVAKLMVNALFASQVAMLGELLAAARDQGIEQSVMMDLLGALPVLSAAAKGAGLAIAAERFEPMFPVSLVAKDLRYALLDKSARMPLTDHLGALFEDAERRGLGAENITAIAKLARDWPTLSSSTRSRQPKDKPMTTLYTARAHVTSGREGSVRTDDGKLEMRLAFPKTLGGDGNGTNPEQLFAAGYGACFGSTLATIAKAEGKALQHVHIDSEVDMNVEGGSYELTVRLSVRAEGVDGATLEGLIEKAKVACPYSRATRGNVPTTVKVAM